CLENDPGVLSCVFIPPCGGYTLKSMGLNATQIDGRKVVLVTDFNQSFTGLPLLIAESHQTFDESTPAPIPTGQPAPPLSPEMADLVAPIVLPSPVPIPFKISPPPTPTPVVVVFNLTTNHPLKWVLTLINETAGQNLDITSGVPGNVAVLPSGGQWSSPDLSVTVTIAPQFLVGLGPGKYDLYMTGVSKRGLSNYAKAIIAVSP